MDFLLDALTDWLKEMLVGGIMSNLSGMFDSVNQQVADIATQVGQTPQGWNGSIFSMIQNLSNSIMVPIAGVILAIVMTLELIQMITDKNNLHDVDTWMIFKWVFKSAAAILIVSNTWNIVMGVFDAAQSVVAQAAGIIGSDASIDISSVMTDMESRLMDMDLGPLFGLWFQSLFIGITMWALYICIFIVIYGRMIEIYLVTSVAPIPTHIDKAHVHNHIIWSSVNLDCDRKFRNFWGSTKAVRRLSDTICIENGLSIVENPKPHGKSYDQWLGDQAKPSHRELLRAAIDNALAQKPADLDELLKLLRESGCEVSKRGKSYRLKLPGWGKVSRLDSLGDGYTLEHLLAVLAGQKEHTPRQKPIKQADPPKVNLLVDIQAKLQAGKGAGYVRWAKVFNLKQMAQTVNFLTEHNLLEYAVLEEKAAAATAHHNELSAKIKAVEKRMAETTVLRTHIVNYAKTRDTYVAYRKAGYSKKFREEHEEEILLHQAAKNAFDDMGVKKLPKVKELQAEYARLLEEKKKTYAEYRRSREKMRELLAAKANVDRLMEMDEERQEDKGKEMNR